MAFETDSTVHETTDGATTSFEHGASDATYSTKTAEGAGVGTHDGDSSDEVNPRKLMSDPHINDIRWLYRTSFGKTLVDKPINDAFKNGFDVKDKENERDDIQSVFEDTEFVRNYQMTQKKARRDGLALMFMVLEDNSDGVHVDPYSENVNVKSVKKLQTITLDDLAKWGEATTVPSGRLADKIPYEEDRYEIRPTGIVVDMDPNSGTYKDPLGYLVGQDKARKPDNLTFIHGNRVQHYTWNPEVDGDLGQDTLGEWEGDSVLVTVYHILRGIKKGNWSIMQTLFRYAAKLYHVELPEDADEDDEEEANEQLQNLNAKGEIITPHGYEMEDFQTDGQLQPREYFDVLFDQVCASLEMTKSVLFGTQTGVVSGSETDIKNYFNQVQRMRQSRIKRDMQSFIEQYYRLTDGRTSENYSATFEVEWGSLFKLSDLDQAETLTRTMQTLSAAIDSFVMTPMEARTILQEEWAEADIDWEDEFSEEETEFLRTLNIAQQGTEAALPPEDGNTEYKGSTQQQNGGGMSKGQTTSSSDPSSDSMTEDFNDRLVDKIAERVLQKMEER